MSKFLSLITILIALFPNVYGTGGCKQDCTDTEPPWMISNNHACGDDWFTNNHKCVSAYWEDNNFCEYSCYKAGFNFYGPCCEPTTPPTTPPPTTSPPCVQDDKAFFFRVNKIMSEIGNQRSDGVLDIYADDAPSKTNAYKDGYMFFSDKLADPDSGYIVGSVLGHCHQVSSDNPIPDNPNFGTFTLVCYYNFIFDLGVKQGRITAQGNLEILNIPHGGNRSDFVITGGTGDFHGIIGGGCIRNMFYWSNTGYQFSYDLVVSHN